MEIGEEKLECPHLIKCGARIIQVYFGLQIPGFKEEKDPTQKFCQCQRENYSACWFFNAKRGEAVEKPTWEETEKKPKKGR